MLNIQHLGRRAEHGNFPFPRAPGRVTTADNDGRDLRDARAAFDRHRIFERQVTGCGADNRTRTAGAGSLRLTGQYHDQMSTQRGELARDVTARAFTDSRQ